MLPVAAEAWGPPVFVTPIQAALLAEALGPLPGYVAESGVDLDRLRCRVRNEWEIECDGGRGSRTTSRLPLRSRAPGLLEGDRRRSDEYELQAAGSSHAVRHRARVRQRKGRLPGGRRCRAAAVPHALPELHAQHRPGPGNMSVDVTRPAGPAAPARRSTSSTRRSIDDRGRDDGVGQPGRRRGRVARRLGAARPVLRDDPHGRLLPSSEHLIQYFQRLVHEALSAD